jgi:hypothetical protein
LEFGYDEWHVFFCFFFNLVEGLIIKKKKKSLHDWAWLGLYSFLVRAMKVILNLIKVESHG